MNACSYESWASFSAIPHILADIARKIDSAIRCINHAHVIPQTIHNWKELNGLTSVRCQTAAKLQYTCLFSSIHPRSYKKYKNETFIISRPSLYKREHYARHVCLSARLLRPFLHSVRVDPLPVSLSQQFCCWERLTIKLAIAHVKPSWTLWPVTWQIYTLRFVSSEDRRQFWHYTLSTTIFILNSVAKSRIELHACLLREHKFAKNFFGKLTAHFCTCRL